MKNFIRRNLAFLLLTLCAAAVAAGILAGRAAVERDYQTYDIVVDYRDLSEMAMQSDLSIEDWLALFRSRGIHSMALFEETLTSLSKLPGSGVSYAKASSIREIPGWWTQYPQQAVDLIRQGEDVYDLLVSVTDSSMYTWILNALHARSDNLCAEAFTENGVGYIWIDGTYSRSCSDWVELPLGLLPQKVSLLQSYGFDIIPRTAARAHLNGAAFARAVLEEFEQYQPAYFMNSGDGVLGYDEPEESRQLLLDYLDRTGAAMVITEEMNQSKNVTWAGFDSLVMNDLDNRAVRAFNEFGFIQNRWQYYGYAGSEEIVNSLFRAVAERNCRIVYLKMILDTDEEDIYITDPAAYEDLLTSLLSRLEDAGLTFGTASAMRSYNPAWYWRLLLGFGCVGGALVLLDLMVRVRLRLRLLLLAVGLAAVSACFYLAPNGAKLLLSIGSGILFACLAGLGAYRLIQAGRWKPAPNAGGCMLRAVGVCIFAGAVALLGALIAAAALSETSYMLEMRLYRGVKLMQLAPIAFLAASFILIFTVEDFGGRPGLLAWGQSFCCGWRSRAWYADQKAAWQRHMQNRVSVRTVWTICTTVVCIVLLGAVGVYYIMRTGNTSASVSIPALELKLRSLLETCLVARPRTKEFLIGWPCLMLMVWALHHRSKLFSVLFSMGAAVGLTSVVNTFQHIRTPLALSMLRTVYGMLLGLAVGLVILIALHLLARLSGCLLKTGEDENA